MAVRKFCEGRRKRPTILEELVSEWRTVLFHMRRHWSSRRVRGYRVVRSTGTKDHHKHCDTPKHSNAQQHAPDNGEGGWETLPAQACNGLSWVCGITLRPFDQRRVLDEQPSRSRRKSQFRGRPTQSPTRLPNSGKRPAPSGAADLQPDLAQ